MIPDAFPRLARYAIAAFISLATACTAHDRQEAAVSIAGRGLPFDSVFHLIQITPLTTPPDQVVGNAIFGTVTSAGNVLLADAAMGDVKVFDRQGRFVKALGKRGQGPGEFILPVSVTQSPLDGRVLVTDLQAMRVTFYDGDSLTYAGLTDFAPPLRISVAEAGHGDTILVAGSVSNPRESTPHAAALMAGRSTVLQNLLPVPPRMLHRASLQNLIRAMADQTAHYLYLTLGGDGQILRLNYNGTLADSIRIPTSLYAGFTLPEHPLGSDSAMQAYFKTQAMTRGFEVLNDSTIVLEVQSYREDAQRFRQTMVVLRWGHHPAAISLSPCDCRLLGSRADTLALLIGGSPDSLAVEWRTLQTTF